MPDIPREQALAYRIAEHGLHRSAGEVTELPLLDLGLQDSMRDTALLSLAARLSTPVTPESLVDDDRLALVWSHRGAPHFHRRTELPELVSALVPLNDQDALSRMMWQKKELSDTGVSAVDVLFETARAIRKVVTRPMTKGAVSAAITKLIPPSFSRWCRGCGATHVHEQLMRLATVHGGVRLEAGQTPATLAPLEGRERMSTSPAPEAAARVLERYLRFNGPATPGDAAGFTGSARSCVTEIWPSDRLTEVRVAGRRTFVPTDQLTALENPPTPRGVRLLPPLDPFTQGRDKAVLVPDKARAKEVWKIIGSPGAVLVDGEILGVWRTKASGKRLRFTVTAFDPLRGKDRADLEAEAERAAAARGFRDFAVDWA
ncbi:winged helix DNA-binding domain-containing protein [Amycolatopsis panacis]|uniref:Winged helix DNA-binding domain-containing protein n=1 Tax=Amycolatopsis panacis TaxID=2340917 RepID=A0A419HSK1_9PSEU|nr:winged helix DNA-binding domain-containing protein [Amycolatopsis panacis]RJQ79565.1 winged helix DNA-binding domain-containing protein [Amycolatopsis panacis]